MIPPPIITTRADVCMESPLLMGYFGADNRPLYPLATNGHYARIGSKNFRVTICTTSLGDA